LDPKRFVHFVSNTPNTTELFHRVLAALIPNGGADEVAPPAIAPTLESQDFGWATGLDKKTEAEELARAFGVEVSVAKRLIKHPLYSYPGGHSFFDLYVDV